MAASKEQSNRSHRESQDNIRDIAKSCPAIQNPRMRQEVLESFPRFFEVVMKPIAYLPCAPVHYRLMEKVETILRQGGNDCTAMPRGSGKSGIYKSGCLWAMLNGYREHMLLVGANQSKANKLMAGMISMLSKFPLMKDLFPEVCWPFWALEGIVQRRLLWDGKPLTYSLKSERIILPDTPLEFNKSGLACVSAFGLHTAIRGEEYTRPDGRSVRPDGLLFDDPQTKQSAKSETQIQDRLERINESIIGASGPNIRLAAMAAVTCIEENDLAERLLADPIWGGEKFALMPTMPTNTKRWDEYGDMLRDDLRQRKGRDRINEYYTTHRTEMDAGGSVYWEHKRKPDEVSALQGAMEIFLLKPETFWADFQQDPAKARKVDENELTVADITARVNGLSRGTVPATATTLTCMMDVQESMFVYAVVAWGNGFTGDVIDFGTFPEQRRSWWTKRKAQQRLDNTVIDGRDLSQSSREDRWLTGLRHITTELLTKDYPREGGGSDRIKRLMIDCQDGDFMSIGYSFIRQSGPLRTLMLPSHGEGMNAASKPIAERDNKPGERRGTEWYVDRHQQFHDERIHYNANYWKEFLRQRLSCDVAAKGALRFWGTDPARHELLATQILSEKPNRVRNETRGRTVTIFGKPNGDNEGLDVLAGNCVAASSLGVQIEGMGVQKAGRRKSPYVSPLKV